MRSYGACKLKQNVLFRNTPVVFGRNDLKLKVTRLLPVEVASQDIFQSCAARALLIKNRERGDEKFQTFRVLGQVPQVNITDTSADKINCMREKLTAPHPRLFIVKHPDNVTLFN